MGYNRLLLGPWYVEGVSYTIRALPLRHSFSRPKGITKWAAQAAHWSLCNQAKIGFSAPSLEHFFVSVGKSLISAHLVGAATVP